jgi:hypothetical protein
MHLSALAQRYNLWLFHLLLQMKALRFRCSFAIFSLIWTISQHSSAPSIFSRLPFFVHEPFLYAGKVDMSCSHVDIQTNSLLVEGERYDAMFHTRG